MYPLNICSDSYDCNNLRVVTHLQRSLGYSNDISSYIFCKTYTTVMKIYAHFGKYIRTVGTGELIGIRHFRLQPGITGHSGNKCNNVMCKTYTCHGVHYLLAVQICYVHVSFLY